jgi:hypothetical protein
MKAILTILFILICGFAALANTNNNQLVLNPQIENHDEIKFSEMGAVMVSGIVVATEYNEVETTTETEVARLYKFKNSRIKKALAFTTKRNKAQKA